MKKTFTRALSLILVLVMMLGVIPFASADSTDTKTIKVGETADINSGLTAGEGEALTWSVSGGTLGTAVETNTEENSTTFSADEAGTYTVTCVKKLWNTETNDFDVVDTYTCTVEVTAAEDGGGDGGEDSTYVVSLPEKLDAVVGAESEKLAVTVKLGDITIDDGNYTVKGWISSDETVATVNSGVVTGVKAGTANITAVVTIEDVDYPSTECAVTVTEEDDIVIECEPKSGKVDTTLSLEPVLKVEGKEVYDAKFIFKPVKSSTNYTDGTKKVSVKRSTGGVVEFNISVDEYKVNKDDAEYVSGADIEPITAYVRFYENVEVILTIADGKTKFGLDDQKVFSKVMLGTKEETSVTDSSFKDLLIRYLPNGDTEWPTGDKKRPSKVYFSSGSSASGQIQDRFNKALESQDWGMLDFAHFGQIQNRTGSAPVSVTVKDGNGHTMLTGTFTFVISGGEGDIHYETTYNKGVTLKESDFQSFWSDLKLGSQHTLEYVTFDTMSLTGTLWTDSNARIPVTSNMKFYVTPGKDQNDLGKVYYKPNSDKTGEYIDSFNFTVYGNYYGQTLESYTGTVTVELNKTATDITSRGDDMGTSYSKAIADAFKSTMNKDLGYVVFELPEAKYGKLYSKLPSELKVVHGKSMTMNYVAQGTELKKDDQLWYTAGTNQLALSSAAFIPAAGFKGEVELKYAAYDQYGDNEYKGTLRFNVSAKTASGIFSDVTSKSYSWAADSADFLYYEGVAQGSKAAGSSSIKYNPSANITRQDFMLMLYRAFLAKQYGTSNVTSNFPDVVKGADAYSREIYQAVGVAKMLGIAQGSNNKFNPKSNITRQEAMVLIYRTLDVINKDLEYTTTTNIAAFKDYSKISNWATASISYLVNHGVIQGSNDNINPTSNITRAEMACILHRVLTY